MSYNFIWLLGQAVKTPPSHGGNRGSIPLGAMHNALERCSRAFFISLFLYFFFLYFLFLISYFSSDQKHSCLEAQLIRTPADQKHVWLKKHSWWITRRIRSSPEKKSYQISLWWMYNNSPTYSPEILQPDKGPKESAFCEIRCCGLIHVRPGLASYGCRHIEAL